MLTSSEGQTEPGKYVVHIQKCYGGEMTYFHAFNPFFLFCFSSSWIQVGSRLYGHWDGHHRGGCDPPAAAECCCCHGNLAWQASVAEEEQRLFLGADRYVCMQVGRQAGM